MKLVSIRLLKDLLSSPGSFEFRRKHSMKFYGGDLVNYSYNSFSIGPSLFTSIDKEELFKESRNYVSFLKGLIISRRKNSVKVLHRYNNFFFYKILPLDSPNLTFISLKEKIFTKKRANISKYLARNSNLKKKLKKYGL